MNELKPCPFCGAPAYELVKGSVKAPDAFWDGGMRGESYNYIMCPSCDVIMKCYDFNDPAVLWNQRAEPQEKEDGVIKCKDCLSVMAFLRMAYKKSSVGKDVVRSGGFSPLVVTENDFCSKPIRKGSNPDVRG